MNETNEKALLDALELLIAASNRMDEALSLLREVGAILGTEHEYISALKPLEHKAEVHNAKSDASWKEFMREMQTIEISGDALTHIAHTFGVSSISNIAQENYEYAITMARNKSKQEKENKCQHV